MKRQSMMKLLMPAAAAMAFATLKADVVTPSHESHQALPPRILSYAEWTREMSLTGPSGGISDGLAVTGAMILVLVAVAMIVCACKVPYLAARLPIPRTVRFMDRGKWRAVLAFALVSAVLWCFWRCWLAAELQIAEDAGIMPGAEVEVKPGETYDEYLHRARGIVRKVCHFCPKCDYPMRSGDDNGGYWHCMSCGYGKERHMGAERSHAFSTATGSRR